MQTENKKKTTTKKQNKKKTNKSMPLHKLKVYIDPPQSIETNPGEICFITDTMTSDPNAKFFQRKNISRNYWRLNILHRKYVQKRRSFILVLYRILF